MSPRRRIVRLGTGNVAVPKMSVGESAKQGPIEAAAIVAATSQRRRECSFAIQIPPLPAHVAITHVAHRLSSKLIGNCSLPSSPDRPENSSTSELGPIIRVSHLKMRVDSLFHHHVFHCYSLDVSRRRLLSSTSFTRKYERHG